MSTDFEIDVVKMKRWESKESATRAFVTVALKRDDLVIYIESITIREITVNDKKKLVVTMPTYKSGDQWRDTIVIKGNLWWDLNNKVLDEYCCTRELPTSEQVFAQTIVNPQQDFLGG